MTGGAILWLAGATAIFICAASALRAYVDAGQIWLMGVSLALYGVGNLMMVRVMRENGLAVAISVSAVLQLVLATLVAFAIFGERPSALQWAGIGFGLLAIGCFVWPQEGAA